MPLLHRGLALLRHPWQGAVLEWSAIVLWVAACAITAHSCCGVLSGVAVWWKTHYDYLFLPVWVWVCGYGTVIVVFYRGVLQHWPAERLLLRGRLLNLAYHCLRWPLFFSFCSLESIYLVAVAYYFDLALGLLTVPYWIVQCVRRGCCCCCAFHEDPSCRASGTFCACCQGADADAADNVSLEADNG